MGRKAECFYFYARARALIYRRIRRHEKPPPKAAMEAREFIHVRLHEKELDNTDDYIRMKHGHDFDQFTKEIMPNGQIVYKYDNGSVSYTYEFTEF